MGRDKYIVYVDHAGDEGSPTFTDVQEKIYDSYEDACTVGVYDELRYMVAPDSGGLRYENELVREGDTWTFTSKCHRGSELMWKSSAWITVEKVVEQNPTEEDRRNAKEFIEKFDRGK